MDKLDCILDLVEHPEKYSSAERDEILSDTECARIYNLLCHTASAASLIEESGRTDEEAEWRRFMGRRSAGKGLSVRRRMAVASAAAMISVAAVAIGIGVATREPGSPAEKAAAASEQLVVEEEDKTGSQPADTLTAPLTETGIVVFENETLENIITRIAARYGAEVRFGNDDVRSLRLYFNWNPENSLRHTLESLDNFETFRISLEGSTVKID